MIFIYKDRLIQLEWSIFRGTSQVPEDFSRALVKLFLVGNYEKYAIPVTAEGGTLVAQMPQDIPDGAYSLEAIWVKNYNNLFPVKGTGTPTVGLKNIRYPGPCHNDYGMTHPWDHRSNDRCLMRSRKEYVFAVTSYPGEETAVNEDSIVTVRINSAVATYGYDGLSAYEIAVLRGDFNGTEGEYLDSLKFKLEVAKEHKLGGITAVTKTDDETEEVKVDPETGRLYVKPGGGALSVATETKLGGIKAATKTSLETQEVKIDPDTGKLYTKPGGEGGVEIVNNPDEEDLHSVEQSADVHVLQFADKEYNAWAFSGLGRVYLRKNISGGKNVLTQAMMNKSNTRYIIQYDYDLDGETITVPEGCVLQFEGGSLSNGTLHGNSTLIHADSECYIFDSISFIGNFKNGCFYADWFGCADIEDCSNNLQRAIDAAQKVSVKSVVLSNKTYNISKTIKVPSFFSFGGLVNNALSVWKRQGTTSLIYQTSDLPIIELGDSEGARNISLHDIALQPSLDYQGTKDNLYGIYTDNINFANNSINNVWVNECKFGMYIRISNGGGFTETSCINLSLTRNIIGLVVENHDVDTVNYLWMNQNYFRLCYFNQNTCGGVWINNRGSYQNNSFQTCNFEGMGTNYVEEDYNTYGCFAFKCNASYGLGVFDSCYVENILPIKDGITRDGINSYDKESGFILGACNFILRNNIISTIRQFITITAAAKKIKLQNNDYYIRKVSEYTSDALIRILNVSEGNRFFIDIDEPKLPSNTAIKRPYILDIDDLSSSKSLYSSSVNIKCPNFTKEEFSNTDYGESFTIYIDSTVGNANYSGLTPYNPFANLDQILSYNITRYTKARNITIELLSDTTFTRSLDREIFQGLNIKFKGNGHKISLSNKQIPLVDCNITFEDVTIEINNTASSYSTFQVFGKATICFENCVISYKGGQAAFFIRSYSGADCYVNFSNSEMNKEGGRIYMAYKGPESTMRVRKIDFTADDILELSDMFLEEDLLNYDYNINLNFTRLSDKKHYVYADDKGNFYNSDGTLTNNVIII